MPSVAIEVRRQYSQKQEVEIIDAVHAALIAGLKVPAWDKHIRLIIHEPHRFAVPPDKNEYFTLISIDLFAGRSLDAKRSLYQHIVKNLGECSIPADQVKIVLREIPQDNWGIRGGVPASEVDLGFEVNV
jgi:phenylpyruvate tautomerase PptA (4-oxalocrotonate tautomerase family)